MSKQIRIVHGQDAGAVVVGVNRLLCEGWRLLDTRSVVATARNEAGLPLVEAAEFLVPEFVVYLTRDGEQ